MAYALVSGNGATMEDKAMQTIKDNSKLVCAYTDAFLSVAWYACHYDKLDRQERKVFAAECGNLATLRGAMRRQGLPIIGE